MLAVGFLTAFVIAYAAVHFLLKFVQKHNFIGFGVYRVLAGVIFIWWFSLHG
jgi:undecaprenyl-diphosphatase